MSKKVEAAAAVEEKPVKDTVVEKLITSTIDLPYLINNLLWVLEGIAGDSISMAQYNTFQRCAQDILDQSQGRTAKKSIQETLFFADSSSPLKTPSQKKVA